MKKQRTYTAREIEKLVTQRAKELNTKTSKTPKVTKLSNNPREKLLRKQLFKDLEVKFEPFKKAVKAKKDVAKVAKVAKKTKKKLSSKKLLEALNQPLGNKGVTPPNHHLPEPKHLDVSWTKAQEKEIFKRTFRKTKQDKTKKKDSSNFLLKILNSFKRKRDK